MRANRLHLPTALAPALGFAGALAAALLLAGCGGNGGSASDCPPAGAGTEAQRTSGGGSDVSYLTDVTVESGRCSDRVVFDFRDDAPGARVEYLPREQALVEDGSGNRVEAEGEAFLVVRLDPAATAEAHGDELEFTYTGPRRLQPDGASVIEEIVKTGDFEAVVTWVIAVSEERPFSVESTDGRVAVDFA